jgi:HTH-type transcriptional regulator/antitoxin HigA
MIRIHHILIPSELAGRLASLNTKAGVEGFAKEIGIHPGIVVGRLQHDGFIQPSWMNDLKEKFEFASNSD